MTSLADLPGGKLPFWAAQIWYRCKVCKVLFEFQQQLIDHREKHENYDNYTETETESESDDSSLSDDDSVLLLTSSDEYESKTDGNLSSVGFEPLIIKQETIDTENKTDNLSNSSNISISSRKTEIVDIGDINIEDKTSAPVLTPVPVPITSPAPSPKKKVKVTEPNVETPVTRSSSFRLRAVLRKRTPEGSTILTSRNKCNINNTPTKMRSSARSNISKINVKKSSPVKSKTKVEKQQFVCNICKKVLSSKQGLTTHLIGKHSKMRNYRR